MTAGAPLLELEQVNKWFGDLHVLQDVDLRVAAGEVVVVVGPSGSGKSTLCRTINRLEPIDSGSIRLDGRPLPAEGRELARLRSDVGMSCCAAAATRWSSSAAATPSPSTRPSR
jgi:glutamate transport system ATP-binding protein